MEEEKEEKGKEEREGEKKTNKRSWSNGVSKEKKQQQQ